MKCSSKFVFILFPMFYCISIVDLIRPTIPITIHTTMNKKGALGTLEISVDSTDDFIYRNITIKTSKSYPAVFFPEKIAILDPHVPIPYVVHDPFFPVLNQNISYQISGDLISNKTIRFELLEGEYLGSIDNGIGTVNFFPFIFQEDVSMLGLFGYYYESGLEIKRVTFEKCITISRNKGYVGNIFTYSSSQAIGKNTSICPKIRIHKNKITRVKIKVSDRKFKPIDTILHSMFIVTVFSGFAIFSRDYEVELINPIEENQ